MTFTLPPPPTPEEEAEYEAEEREYESLYPNLGFTLDIRRDELDDELSKLDMIIIKNDKECCYCEPCDCCGITTCDLCGGYDTNTIQLPETDYIEVKKPVGQNNITIRDVVNKLNEIHYQSQFPKMYSPHFLERIFPSVGSNVQFDLWFGS